MFTLIKVTNEDEYSLKLEYLFTKQATNNEWKKRYQMNCYLRNITPLSQDHLTEFEYFKQTKKQLLPFEFSKQKYLLLVSNNPVTSIYTITKGNQIVDITITTLPDYQNKGYAKKAIQLVEEKVFTNPNILYTSMVDITKERITSRIAIALGYIYHEETNTFVKANPNLEKSLINCSMSKHT